MSLVFSIRLCISVTWLLGFLVCSDIPSPRLSLSGSCWNYTHWHRHVCQTNPSRHCYSILLHRIPAVCLGFLVFGWCRQFLQCEVHTIALLGRILISLLAVRVRCCLDLLNPICYSREKHLPITCLRQRIFCQFFDEHNVNVQRYFHGGNEGVLVGKEYEAMYWIY